MSRPRRAKPASHSASVPPTADTLTFQRPAKPHAATYETAVSPRLAGITRGLQDASVMHMDTSVQRVPDLGDEASRDNADILDVLRPRARDAAAAAIPRHREVSLHAFESQQGDLE